MSSAVSQPAAIARLMAEVDIPNVLGIEREAYRFPWSRGVFKDCLRVGYSCWVLQQGPELHGYGIMSIAAGESHILNLCVRPRAQRRGYGELMLRHLCAVAHRLHAQTTLLEVRPSNAVAVRLYERHGFRRVGTRRAYYPDHNGREDAFVYALDLGVAEWL